MNPAIEQLTHAAPALRAGLQHYATTLQRILESRLLGLTLYGPVLTREFDPAHMLATSVLVVEQVDLAVLRRIAEHGSTFGARGIAAPVVMTPEYIRESVDTFPLEMLEIHQMRRTLAGRDCFDAIALDAAHLRLQCEQELKRILIRMRQALLAAGTREDVLGEIEADIGIQLLRTLRGALWLHDKKQFVPREQVLAETERWLGSTLAGARSVILSPGGLGWPEFQAFYADVEKLAERTDAL
ncbi:MAG TPA: hypothetical protein VNT79_07520 [Phycisphaerae bacterium]|nr:hypothetical protein [Phycisphaerae bacterium]